MLYLSVLNILALKMANKYKDITWKLLMFWGTKTKILPSTWNFCYHQILEGAYGLV